MGEATLPRSRRDFGIAIFCALEKEFNAVKLVLDEIWDDKLLGFNKRVEGDDNLPYILGRISGKHNIVLVKLRSAGMGKGAAASSASYLCGSYPSIRIALLVGICGGVPGVGKSEVLLGDVVVSSSSQVRQYDFGKLTPNGFTITDSDHGLKTDPTIDLFVSRLKLEESIQPLNESLAKALPALQSKKPGKYDYPGYEKDLLFPSSYRHNHRVFPECICKSCLSTHDAVYKAATEETCSEVQCDLTKMVQPRLRLQKIRRAFEAGNPQWPYLPAVHFGVMGCGDAVIKSGEERDRIARETCAIALEMESAGIFQSLSGIVIKSVCDYADSHKNKVWQEYASAVAAATTKALLEQMDSVERDSINGESRRIQQIKKSDSVCDYTLSLNEYSWVRYSLCDDFLGRDDALKHMEIALFSNAKFDKQKRFVIHGMGGIGKTQLCLRFARVFEHRFWGIFLVGASSKATAEEHFTDIARRLSSPAPSFDSGIELLRREQRPWLLILDNADDSNTDLYRYFPPTERGCVLITTRLIKWNGESYQTIGTLELREMSVDKSIDIFLLNAGKKKEDERNRNLAQPIVEELGCLPLALSVAAAPILSGSWQLENYWKFYKDRKQELMERKFTDRENRYSRSIFATFNASRKIMLQQTYFKPEVAQRAIEILDLCSFMHSYEIPEKVIFMAPSMKTHSSIREYLAYPLSLSWKFWGNRRIHLSAPPETAQELTREQIRCALSDIKELPSTIAGAEEEKRRLRNSEALALLRASGLGNLTNDGSFSIHPLIREWAQWRLTPASMRRARWAAGVALANTVTWERHPELWRQLYPHIEFYLRSGAISGSETNMLTLDQAEVAEKFSLVCCECGTFSLAENLAQETLQAMRYYRGTRHTDRLRSQGTLTEVLVQRREYKNAIALSEETLKSRQETLGEGHTLTLKSLSTYAIALDGLGRYEESERMSRLCLERYDETIGEESYDGSTWVEIKCNLASTLQKEAKFSEATQLMNEAYVWRLKNLGERHPDTMKSLVNLASILTDNGHIQKATEELRNALKLQIVVLGDQHPDTLGTMSDLARVLMKLDFTLEAEKLTQGAIEGIKQRMGTGNLHTLDVMYSHAMMVEKLKDYEEAEKLYRSLMEGYKTHLHENHPDVLRTMMSLAVMVTFQGPSRYDEAENIYMATIKGFTERYDFVHPDIVACRANLAVLLEKRMKFQAAEEMHCAVERDLPHFGVGINVSRLNCLHNFSKFLRNRGRYAEAETRAREAMIGLEEVLGPDKRSTLNCAHTLAVILERQEKYVEAWQLYKRACDGYKKSGDSRLAQYRQTFKQFEEKMKCKGISEPIEISITEDKNDGRINGGCGPNKLKRQAELVTELDMHHANVKKPRTENDR